MAAFADMAAAEVKAKEIVASKAAIEAYAGRSYTGVICVRAIRRTVFADFAFQIRGGWEEFIDDGVLPPPPAPEGETE